MILRESREYKPLSMFKATAYNVTILLLLYYMKKYSRENTISLIKFIMKQHAYILEIYINNCNCDNVYILFTATGHIQMIM